MKTKEELSIWDAMDLLTKVQYELETIARKTKDKEIFREFTAAAKKIYYLGDHLTPRYKPTKKGAEKLI